MRLAKLLVQYRSVSKSRVFVVLGAGLSVTLSACTTSRCDSTGAMAAHCAPVKNYAFTGESFEEDKMFYYQDADLANRNIRDIPATALSERVLKGQKDYHIVWSQDGLAKKAVFYKRPASF